MSDLKNIKQSAREAAFRRRAKAHAALKGSSPSKLLSEYMGQFCGRVIAGYMPIRSEIDPLPVMTELSEFGSVCVPVIVGKDLPLKFSTWTPGCSLKEGTFGTLIPEADVFILPEILIVPLVAFNRRGERLGYGGGFYDRTLELYRAKRPTLAIGFAYGDQEDEGLPLNPTDQHLDMVVTEREVIEIVEEKRLYHARITGGQSPRGCRKVQGV